MDHGLLAVAAVGGIAEVTARTGVAGGNQHEAGGKCDDAGGFGYCDGAVFERLPEYFQDRAREFGDFIEEQDATVSQSDLPGPGLGAAADEGGAGDGVMRGTRWSRADDARVRCGG